MWDWLSAWQCGTGWQQDPQDQPIGPRLEMGEEFLPHGQWARTESRVVTASREDGVARGQAEFQEGERCACGPRGVWEMKGWGARLAPVQAPTGRQGGDCLSGRPAEPWQPPGLPSPPGGPQNTLPWLFLTPILISTAPRRAPANSRSLCLAGLQPASTGSRGRRLWPSQRGLPLPRRAPVSLTP